MNIAKNLATLSVFAVNTQCVIADISGSCAEDVAQNVASALVNDHILSKPVCFIGDGKPLSMYAEDMKREVRYLVSDYMVNPPKVEHVDIITMAQDCMFDGNNSPDWENTMLYRQCGNIIEEGINGIPGYRALLDNVDRMDFGALACR